MNDKDVEYEVITVHNFRDYNTAIALLKEHKLIILRIKTVQKVDGTEEISIHTEGDKNHIEFVKYLLKKEQEKTQELLDSIKVK